MESVIREGTLRLLTAESTCDVILCCQGQRLMAHKVILSMASPVFRNLFIEDCASPAVVILPDISSHTMSLILDYIYSGTVIVQSNTMQSFLSLVKLLKVKLDLNINSNIIQKPQQNHLPHRKEKLQKFTENNNNVKEKIESFRSKKTMKRLPQLIPINKVGYFKKSESFKRTNSYILPSPWKPRVETVFGDPRHDILENSDYSVQKPKFYENDSNNNFQPTFFSKYQTNMSALVKQSNKYLPERNFGHFFSNSNHSTKSSKSILNTTLSRPPEDECIDRNKKNIEEKLSEIKDCVKDNLETFEKQNRNNTPEKTTLEEDSENIHEESNGSIQKNDDNISAVKTDRKCQLELFLKKEKPFKCEDCGKCFSQLRNFKYHRSVHEGTKEFAAKCLECGKVFNDKGYLSSHMKIHRDKKEYACPHCPKRFNQRVAYNMHLRIHTGVKPHECPTCKKTFSRKMLLKQHQRVHTGERPYSCPECGKTFADRSNMSLHARLHTGIKPYACNVCPKSFTKKHHLKTHMNFHTGLKPYTCQKCGLAFSQSSNMRTHYKKCLKKHQVSENEILPNEEENKTLN